MFPNTTGLSTGPALLPTPYPPGVAAPLQPGNAGALPLDRTLRDLPQFENLTLEDLPQFQPSTTPIAATRAATHAPNPFGMVHDGRTVGEWIARYGEAIWNRDTPELPPINISPEVLRQEVMNGIGGRTTPHGRQVSRQFSEVRSYLQELVGLRGRYLATYPQHAKLVRDTADSFMRSACSRMSHGLHDSRPGSLFAFRIDPLIAHAETANRAGAERAAAQEAAAKAAVEAEEKAKAEAVRSAEQKIQREVASIMGFWRRNLDGTEEWMAYVLGGQMVFESVEDMERNCPPGAYRKVHDPFLSQALHGQIFEYGGSGVVEVYLRIPSGRFRQVAFRGPTWAYLSEDPQAPSGPVLESHPALHTNRWWNPEPRIVQARIDGSQLSRNR